MNPEIGVLRLPNPAYEGKNGFDAVGGVGVELGESDLLDRYRSALFILTQKDRPIPTLQEMEEELAKPDDLRHLEQEISKVGEQHLFDLERLYTFHAEEYYDECVDRYLAKDDTQILVEDETNPTAVASYKKLEELYEDTRFPADLISLWDNDLALMRYTHLRHLHSLYQKRVEIETAKRLQEAQEEEARRRQEGQFPVSIEDFRRKPKDVQHRAARFLVLDDGVRQEKMLTEYGWAWRQVKPLQEEMAKSAEFKAEIQALVIELDIQDPRKRSTVT